MPRSQRNDNFIDKTFTVIADILLKVLPTSNREKQAFMYYRDGMSAQSSGEYAEALQNYYQAMRFETDAYVRSYILYNIGLIHTSKMTPECKEKFHKGEFKGGMTISFWIKEITSDKKIILTDEDPSIRKAEIEDFKEKNLGSIKGGEVISVQPFGTLVKLQKDIVGLISQKEIKTKKKNFSIGDTVMVSIDRVYNDKIFLSLPNES